MTEARSVKIGPSFFEGAFRDYADWKWAWVREIMQNSIDSGSTRIEVEVISHTQDNITQVMVYNNGSPMDEDTLCNKLLALGESGKRFQNGCVGGFGKAKELLYFCHQSWSISTGNLWANGSGGEYTLSSMEFPCMGTRSTVTMKGLLGEQLMFNFNLFASLVQWKGELILNGQKVSTDLRKGSYRRDMSWGRVYTNNAFSGILVCRINGVPMFAKEIKYKGTVLIEMQDSTKLTSNRDALCWTPGSELEQFLVDISTNSRKALKETKSVQRVRFTGYKLAGRAEDVTVEVGAPVAVKSEGVTKAMTVAALALQERFDTPVQGEKGEKTTTETPIAVKDIFRPEFFIKSEIGGTIPARFMPDTFSANSRRLISNWISLLLELANLTKSTRAFSVGFIFDQDCLAQCELEQGEYVLYVNPITLKESAGQARQLLTRWKFNAAGNWDLLATAIHEFVHLEGFTSHDEAYAARLTELMALVFQNRTRFSRHFSEAECWPTT